MCFITRSLENKRVIVTFSYVTFMFYCPSSKLNTKNSDCSQRTPTRISAEARAVLSGTSLQQQQGQSGSCHRSCNHIASRLLDVLLYSNHSNTPIRKYKFSYIVKKNVTGLSLMNINRNIGVQINVVASHHLI